MKLTVESRRLDRAALVGRICNAGSQRLQRGEEGQMDRGHQISVGTNDYFRPHKWKENRGQTENLLVPEMSSAWVFFFWGDRISKKGEGNNEREQLVWWQLQINSLLFEIKCYVNEDAKWTFRSQFSLFLVTGFDKHCGCAEHLKLP